MSLYQSFLSLIPSARAVAALSPRQWRRVARISFRSTPAVLDVVEQIRVVADGLTEIKGRGNYTWTLPSKKKPYQIKFADGNSQNILGMGSGRAWVLLANTTDASLMRNKVALDLAESHVSDAGAEALAASPHLGGLIDLNLYGNLITARAAARLRERFGQRVHL